MDIEQNQRPTGLHSRREGRIVSESQVFSEPDDGGGRLSQGRLRMVTGWCMLLLRR